MSCSKPAGPNRMQLWLVPAPMGLGSGNPSGRSRPGLRLWCRAAATPGGGVRSAEITLPGFIHDTCSSVSPMGYCWPFLSTLPLEKHGLQWVFLRWQRHIHLMMAQPASFTNPWKKPLPVWVRIPPGMKPCWRPCGLGRNVCDDGAHQAERNGNLFDAGFALVAPRIQCA